MFVPKRGFRRTLGYYRLKVMRIGGSPHAVAAGVAVGVLSAWTPFLGFHVLFAIPIAWLLGGSMIAAAIGTTFANPLTCPIIWPLTWEVGQFMLGAEPTSRHIDLEALFAHLDVSQLWGPVLEPMLVGSLPLGLLCALFFYAVTYLAVRGFRDRRLGRLTERARHLKSAETGSAI
ncbi:MULTISPECIES: DUF2062 domain-containing protein [Rhizobiaceae]|jgi:uncharacterized protein (DUF2062 family)|uniref:DUF2062 domain-containing protein n=1 Tax=Aliirhizobium cellulosilyticum TaxID=393664 RepID=A0A7W6TH81_9HYPH|nr:MULTISPECIES: DUF2062 domain-containing protein [Rhizobium/Agrobacterium group]MBB4350565.1 hypothetical protein [Rhizobium cellulosilyticum]MBB4413403.1 hypothetical protein [Rhizobium cellulosilyticum]MBB4448036.1 hypothetical protein [Rhizobium cellulosilyticum]MBO0142475.1 DUF2062 domain-containing protein [Agrobacterium sp. Ap1]